MCGEHDQSDALLPMRQGSSPHVRGALCDVADSDEHAGIIPACAGSTVRACSLRLVMWDHPRMCGEHWMLALTVDGEEGSSPHVRGARVDFLPDQLEVGIIPACAGSTCAVSCPLPSVRDHPRMCGEHAWFEACRVELEGSSPHVRGARSLPAMPCGVRGIIPACAGSTGWGPSPSPPSGIIPACAGSTADWNHGGHCQRDHPRMCGEHILKLPAGLEAAGSSPHVRGAPNYCTGGTATPGSSPHVRGARA